MKFKEVLCFIQTWWPLLVGAGVYLYSESLRTKSLTQYHETSQHRRAKKPAVPARWLRKDPTGLILGKVGKRYFCLPEGTEDTDCMSAIIWGGSGSGKTSGPIGSSILQLQEDLMRNPEKAWTAMVCDLKGEISQLAGGTTKTCTDPNDPDPTTFYLIDPLEENRSFSVGWDPYFRLRQVPHPSSDLRIEVFTGIAKCFIPEDRSQPYFSENAQAMLCGFLNYGFEHGEELVDTDSDPEKKLPSSTKQIAELTAQLKSGIMSYLQSGKYKELLRAMAKFPNYSLNNTILISLQTNGQATQVAPYTAWKSMGRSVNAGEKGIKIIAPTPYQRTLLQEKKDANGKSLIGPDGNIITEVVKVRAMGYRVAYTFDISQTSGKDLPAVMAGLQGKVPDYESFRKAIQEACPVEIVISPVEGSVKGYYSPAEQEVRIREGMSELQNIKTALHETAHARIHNPMLTDHPFSKEEKEIQAESISFIVAAHYGLDTSDYSFPYISIWASGNMKQVEANLEIIKKESAKIISEIDESLEKSRMEQMQSGIYQYDEGYLKLQRQEDDSWHYERYGKDMQPKVSGSVEQKGLRLDQAATSALFILGYTGSKHLIPQESELSPKNMVDKHTRSRHR